MTEPSLFCPSRQALLLLVVALISPAAGSAEVGALTRDREGILASYELSAGGRALAVDTNEIIAEKSLDLGRFVPERLAMTTAGEILVIDSRAGGLHVLGLYNGDYVSWVPQPGVTSVAVDWQGNLIVGGSFGARVIEPSGDPILELDGSEARGAVTDVAVDRNGLRYMTLYESSARVVVFDEGGDALFEFGATGDGDGELSMPLAIAVGPTGDIALADTGHGLVQIFDSAGGFLRAFGGLGPGPGKFVHLQALAYTGSGLLFASDSFQSWVQVFDPDGSLRGTVGTYGSELGELMTPIGVALSEADDRLVVASLNSASLQVFQIEDDLSVGPIPSSSHALVDFGDQPVGTVGSIDVVLSNVGDTPLVLYGVTIGDGFLVSNACGQEVPAGGMCILQVSFQPDLPGPRVGSLDLVDNAVGSPRSIPVSGDAIRAADLALESVVDPARVAPGEIVTYTLSVTNDGPSEATGLTLIDTSPPEASFGAASGKGWSCSENAGTVTCTLPSLAAGRIATPLVITASAPTIGGTFTSLASVSAEAADLRLDDNLDSAIIEVDSQPPTVLVVGSIAATSDSRLRDGESTATPITQIKVVFSEAMNDPVGDTAADDITNPDGYLLLSPGENEVYDTKTCAGGLAADDTSTPVHRVRYDEGSTTAYMALNGGISLAEGSYRLQVCGTTSVVDRVGHPLDGDGSGDGGDDFYLELEVRVTDLLRNQNFDEDLSFWTVTGPDPGAISHSGEDADAAVFSGSVEVSSLTRSGELFTISQCVAAAEDNYLVAGRLRVSSDFPGAPLAMAIVDAYSDPGCSGEILGGGGSNVVGGDTASSWTGALRGLISLPEDTRSARVTVATDASQATSFSLNLDNLSFQKSFLIFGDGFESGDTSAWLPTVP